MLDLRSKHGRELAILGASWLDVALEINLREHFLPAYRVPTRSDLFRSTLKSFESKINVARAMGAMPPEIADHVDLVRRVRNEFAHTIDDIDLEAPVMKTSLGQMTLTPARALDGLTIDKSAPKAKPYRFRFGQDEFESDVAAIADSDGRVLFFVPDGSDRSSDDILRRQIYGCMIGVLGFGLRPWLDRESRPGGLPIERVVAGSE